MRARYRRDRLGGLGLNLVAQLIDADVYLDDEEEEFVVVHRNGEIESTPDLRIGRLRLCVESQRFYISARDVEDLMPGVRITRQDR